MLKYKVKNLINAFKDREVNVIAHQCNCFCKMGAGIAGAISKSFPEAKKADDKTPAGEQRKLGSLTKADVGIGYVYNLYGQYYPGKGTDYYSLKQAMRQMAEELRVACPNAKIGVPKLGCGIGGGRWDLVSEMIEEVFCDFDVTVYVLSQSEIPTTPQKIFLDY